MTAPDRIIPVPLAHAPHEIHIGSGILSRVGEKVTALASPRPVAVVSDESVARHHGDTVRTSLEAAGFSVRLHTIPAGEASKSLETLATLYDFFVREGLDRSSIVLALGGGVVGDLAGFAAASFLRGLPLVQVGTSVIAQVDSSIGGKTGINLPQGKNLAGAFHQPRRVLSDVDALATLPRKEFVAGLAEVVKYGVIADADLFETLHRNADRILRRETDALIDIVERSSRIKADIVTRDEREEMRRILNFGHTIGHALETVHGYGALRHGEAVAIGMVAAARLAKALGRCDASLVSRLTELLSRLGLPVRAPVSADPDALLEILRRDKKVRQGKLVFVLPVTVGHVEIDEDVDAGPVLDAMTSILPE